MNRYVWAASMDLVAFVVLLLGGCWALFKAIDDSSASIKEGEPYVDIQVWGPPVVQVGNCYYSKYSANCYIRQEGGSFVRRDMRSWPGGTIQVGERIGVNYRVGEKVVEKWNIRSGHARMSFHSACFKKYADCRYPRTPE